MGLYEDSHCDSQFKNEQASKLANIKFQDYGNSIAYIMSHKNIHSLQQVMNNAARVVNNTQRNRNREFDIYNIFLKSCIDSGTIENCDTCNQFS